VEDIPSNRVLDVVVADNLLSKKFDASQRAMVAQGLRPFYKAMAKERQRESGGDQKSEAARKSVPEKVPEPITDRKARESRNQAGKAAGVNGRYVDMAEQAKVRKQANGGDKTAEVEKIPPPVDKAKSRDAAGRPDPASPDPHYCKQIAVYYERDVNSRLFAFSRDSLSFLRSLGKFLVFDRFGVARPPGAFLLLLAGCKAGAGSPHPATVATRQRGRKWGAGSFVVALIAGPHSG
jgi:hypothetical protein